MYVLMAYGNWGSKSTLQSSRIVLDGIKWVSDSGQTHANKSSYSVTLICSVFEINSFRDKFAFRK